MRRRLVAAAAVVTAATLVVAGCSSSKSSGSGGSGSSGSGGKVTLKLVAADYGTGPSNTSQKYWQGIADAFHAKNPDITVSVTTINWNDFDTQVQTMIQNHQYPDITEGDYFSTYAQEGLLYSADEVLSDPGNLLSVFAGQGTYNGKQYGMPFTTSARTLFYNKKLFSQAGISAAPQTWADVQTDAAKIKALGKVGFGLPLGSEEAQAESLLWMLGDGGGYKDSSGNWTIDSAPNVTAFQFLKGLVSAGDTEPNPGTKNRTDLWKQFAQGEIGMINGSPALIPIIQSGGVLTSADWTSVPIAGKSGPLTTTLGVCDNVAAFKENGHQAQIKAFLDAVESGGPSPEPAEDGLLALEAIQPRDFVRESNTILKFMQRVLWGKRQDGYILNSQNRYRCQIHEKDVIEKLGGQIEPLEHGSEAHDAFVRFNAAA
ncbi:MAG: extracellular solute-binding protein, partial [Actinobacteria bacterium]|nr:extracellular solute-binding protein [Actinomycetota bacterium]